jgi:hypothetical protein
MKKEKEIIFDENRARKRVVMSELHSIIRENKDPMVALAIMVDSIPQWYKFLMAEPPFGTQLRYTKKDIEQYEKPQNEIDEKLQHEKLRHELDEMCFGGLTEKEYFENKKWQELKGEILAFIVGLVFLFCFFSLAYLLR